MKRGDGASKNFESSVDLDQAIDDIRRLARCINSVDPKATRFNDPKVTVAEDNITRIIGQCFERHHTQFKQFGNMKLTRVGSPADNMHMNPQESFAEAHALAKARIEGLIDELKSQRLTVQMYGGARAFASKAGTASPPPLHPGNAGVVQHIYGPILGQVVGQTNDSVISQTHGPSSAEIVRLVSDLAEAFELSSLSPVKKAAAAESITDAKCQLALPEEERDLDALKNAFLFLAPMTSMLADAPQAKHAVERILQLLGLN